MLGVGDPGDGLPRLQPHGVGIELESHPFACRGQRTGVLAARLALGPPVGRIDIAPHHTVFPVALEELEHHQLGQRGRIETDPREDLGRGRHLQGQALIDRLDQSVAPLLERGLTGFHGAFRGFHPDGQIGRAHV